MAQQRIKNQPDSEALTRSAVAPWPAGYYDDEIDLREYVDVLRRRWLLALGIPALAVLVAAILSFFVLPPVYEATAGVVILKAQTEVQFEPKIRTELTQDVTSRRETLQALVTSRSLAAQVIERMGGALPADLRTVDDLLSSVSSNLRGDLLTLKVENTDPALAAALANTWAETYTAYVNPLFSDVAQTPETLAPQVESAERDYQAAEDELVQFLAENPIPRLERQVSDSEERANKQYADLRGVDNLIADVETLQRQIADGGTSALPTSLGNSLAAVFLRARTFTASSQAGIPTQLQIDPAAWANASGGAAAWQRELDDLLALLRQRRQELNDQVESTDWEQQLLTFQSDLERQTARQQELTQTRDLAWDTYTSLRRKYTEVSVATAAPDLQVSVAMHAEVPEEPVAPRKLLNVALAGVLGLMLGVFAASVLAFLEHDEEAANSVEMP